MAFTRRPGRTSQRRAFTLVELLVVIAIVVIVLALLIMAARALYRAVQSFDTNQGSAAVTTDVVA